jgi:sulfoacetaldehyde acetyltransferase
VVIWRGGIEASRELAERLSMRRSARAISTMTPSRARTRCCRPLGYNGSKAAMELISKADVVLALGTRLNPFSTLPGYGIDYWPKDAKIIQVDINSDRIGLTKKVTVGIQGDAKKVAEQILAKLSPTAGDAGRKDRKR